MKTAIVTSVKDGMATVRYGARGEAYADLRKPSERLTQSRRSRGGGASE